jgi:hypothetical protein
MDKKTAILPEALHAAHTCTVLLGEEEDIEDGENILIIITSAGFVTIYNDLGPSIRASPSDTVQCPNEGGVKFGCLFCA